jgi:hypothetical protein
MALLMVGVSLWVPADERWMTLGLGALVVLILVWIIYGTWYRFEDDHLLCRSGPFTERIPYARIKSITPCRNLLSSMATARDRLKIAQHDKPFVTGTTYISPIDQDQFLKTLRSRCPNLNLKSP